MTPAHTRSALAVLLLASPWPWPVPLGAGTPAGPEYGSYGWPVEGRVLRGFEPPPTPYSSGHRGIDIAAPTGTSIAAPSDGVVAFAGWVGGSLFISIDHPDGVRTTYSWLSSASVVKGASVAAGSPIGTTGHGHPEVSEPHLHFGARIGTTYIDPMLLLERGSVVGLIHLAPLGGLVPLEPGRHLDPDGPDSDFRLWADPTMAALVYPSKVPWTSRSPPDRVGPRLAAPGGQSRVPVPLARRQLCAAVGRLARVPGLAGTRGRGSLVCSGSRAQEGVEEQPVQ